MYSIGPILNSYNIGPLKSNGKVRLVLYKFHVGNNSNFRTVIQRLILNSYFQYLNLIGINIFVNTEGYEFEYTEAQYSSIHGLEGIMSSSEHFI